MTQKSIFRRNVPALLFLFSIAQLSIIAAAASCTTQSKMNLSERESLSAAARTIAEEAQRGDAQAIRANTIPAVAADFDEIADSLVTLKPFLQQAHITVDHLYILDASSISADGDDIYFYCGTPVVVLNFRKLPQGNYALAILHATGVRDPQQMSFILSQTAQHVWMLAGFFTRPIREAGHDGLWYWKIARAYAQKNMSWNALLYYRIAAYLLDPVEFLSSPNLDKILLEQNNLHPVSFPDVHPLLLDDHNSVYKVTSIDTTTTFGALDVELHYLPNAAQTVQLLDPTAARMQATAVMTALLNMRPELREAFHGVWVRADNTSFSLYSFELPMDQIPSAVQLPKENTASLSPVETAISSPTHDSSIPEVQSSLEADDDPIPSPDSDTGTGHNLQSSPVEPGQIHKRKDGIYTMLEEVDEVLLNCAVVDEKGRSVTDLTQKNFFVSEDGIPQTIRFFLHQNLPVSLGILIDSSGSMLNKRDAVDTATMNFLRASNPLNSTFIVNFSDKAYLDQGFTSDIGKLNRAVLHSGVQNTTALYDAVAAAASELANHGQFPKQVLLVITDGADNASRLTLEETIRRVQNLGGPVVYTIGLPSDTNKEEEGRARTALNKLAKETGGIAFFPPSLQDVNTIAAEVARDIRDQYTIGYHSSQPINTGDYRVVHVEANARKHGRLIVRTRNGYYARKPALQQAHIVQKAR